jgi:hypothetical protein
MECEKGAVRETARVVGGKIEIIKEKVEEGRIEDIVVGANREHRINRNVVERK